MNRPIYEKEDRELLRELQKRREELDRITKELSEKTTELEEYRRISVPLSVHKPMVDKYLLSQQKIKALQAEITELRIQQNMLEYHKKIIKKISQEDPAMILETASRIAAKEPMDAKDVNLASSSTIHASITKEDMMASMTSKMSRTKKRREQRKRKAQLFQQAEMELKEIQGSDHPDSYQKKQKHTRQSGLELEETPCFNINEQSIATVPGGVFNEMQKLFEVKSKEKIFKEQQARLRFRSITTGQGEEFIVLSDSEN